jgi:hypothetical protein
MLRTAPLCRLQLYSPFLYTTTCACIQALERTKKSLPSLLGYFLALPWLLFVLERMTLYLTEPL